jgi:hypothetical protein
MRFLIILPSGYLLLCEVLRDDDCANGLRFRGPVGLWVLIELPDSGINLHGWEGEKGKNRRNCFKDRRRLFLAEEQSASSFFLYDRHLHTDYSRLDFIHFFSCFRA